MVSVKLNALLKSESQRVSIVLGTSHEALSSYCQEHGHELKVAGGRLRVEIEVRHLVAPLLAKALACGVEIEEVMPRHETLEELFVREAIAPGEVPTH